MSDGSGASSGSEGGGHVRAGVSGDLASEPGATLVTEVTAVRVRTLPLEQCRNLLLQAEERCYQAERVVLYRNQQVLAGAIRLRTEEQAFEANGVEARQEHVSARDYLEGALQTSRVRCSDEEQAL